MIGQSTILLIDNSATSLTALTDTFAEQGYNLLSATDGKTGLITAEKSHPELILLDVHAPDTDGYDICRILKQQPHTRDIPVLFISAMNGVEHIVKAFRCGAVDFIAKPIREQEVLARVENQLELLYSRRSLKKAKETIEEWSSTLEQHITERTKDIMRNERRLRYLALHDSVTQLPNRNAMQEALTRITESSDGSTAAVVYIELEGFGDINRTYGHHTGDELIQLVSERLYDLVDEWNRTNIVHGALYRTGGSEFVVLLENVEGEATIIQTGEVLLAAMKEPFTIRETQLYLPAQAGYSVYPDDGIEEEILLQNAQMAVDDARNSNELPTRLHRFHAGLAETARARLDTVNMLRNAVRSSKLYIEYQPKIDLSSLTIIGMEALVRWKPDGAAPVPPSVFIPLSEETAIIHDLGEFVLHSVCQQIAGWKADGINPPPVAVNISPLQLNRFNFADQFLTILDEFNIRSTEVIIEITETAFMHDPKQTLATLYKLQEAGVKIHLDDFGTGYSSFSYLSDLPIDCVKIDKSFLDRCVASTIPAVISTADVGRQVNHRTILQGIITLATGLHLDIIAEGVETPEQVSLLQQLGCRNAQGFYFFRPLSVELLTNHLQQMTQSQDITQVF